jgi:hypothetical protein
MSLLVYTYQRTDESLDAVACRFGTTADAIRDATRNPGPVTNWPHDIDDPAWGTRDFDYGANIIIPVPDDSGEQGDDSGTNGPICVAAAPMASSSVYLTSLKPVEQLADEELGPSHEAAINAGNLRRQAAIESELRKRIDRMVGTAMPKGTWPGAPANVQIEPDVALKILDNYNAGEMPWRPELGTVGRAAWFVTEGNPYVGSTAGKTVSLQVEINSNLPRETITLAEKKADEPLYQQKLKEVQPTLEGQIRQKYGIREGAPLLERTKVAKEFARRLDSFAEAEMWKALGERAAGNPGTVIEVKIPKGEFSLSGSGTFAVVADRSAIRIQGGPAAVVDALKDAGVSAEPVVEEAAQALATRLKWAGRVRGVFRYGGRVMIVVAIAADLVKIYYAQDHVKAVVTSAGGWAGATAAGSAFAAWWTPADVAGPWAWAAHGVGTLIAGGVGYWVGSSVTRTIYELVAEGGDDGTSASETPSEVGSWDPADAGVGAGPGEDDE